jgi:hypothetical protein
MINIWPEAVSDWVLWVYIGYSVVGMALGFLFGSICGWLHPANHIIVWWLAWPIMLFNMLFGTISGKIACKKYGHITEDCVKAYSMNSNIVEFYCNRCGTLLMTKSLDVIDDKTKDIVEAFNDVGNKMFPGGSSIKLKIVK